MVNQIQYYNYCKKNFDNVLVEKGQKSSKASKATLQTSDNEFGDPIFGIFHLSLKVDQEDSDHIDNGQDK